MEHADVLWLLLLVSLSWCSAYMSRKRANSSKPGDFMQIFAAGVFVLVLYVGCNANAHVLHMQQEKQQTDFSLLNSTTGCRQFGLRRWCCWCLCLGA
jgi:hypothetical protein